MKSLEDRIADFADGGQEFALRCAEAFGSGPGAEVLALLCSVEHPLTSPVRATTEETYQAIGRREVITLLWRLSQPKITPIEAQKLLPPFEGKYI